MNEFTSCVLNYFSKQFCIGTIIFAIWSAKDFVLLYLLLGTTYMDTLTVINIFTLPSRRNTFKFSKSIDNMLILKVK